ncbi:protein of unknown function [Hyphomicrobium sp. 1Nfss2.1]
MDRRWNLQDSRGLRGRGMGTQAVPQAGETRARSRASRAARGAGQCWTEHSRRCLRSDLIVWRKLFTEPSSDHVHASSTIPTQQLNDVPRSNGQDGLSVLLDLLMGLRPQYLKPLMANDARR